MTISNGGIARATNPVLANAVIVAPKRSFLFKGQRFSAKGISISYNVFTHLGFNPRRFNVGVKVYLLDRESYDRFCATCKIKDPRGIYPFAQNGDVDAVIRGEIPFLPNRSRIIVLPEDHQNVDLIHELLHDIFVGGGLSAEARTEFVKAVLFGYRLSIDPNYPAHHKNRSFYEEVARICRETYNLANINPCYNIGRYWEDPEFQIFAGEGLAYSGEFILDPQNSRFKEIPEGMLRQLRALRLFDRSRFS